MFVFLSGKDKGKTRIYQQDRVTIGPAEACDLVVALNGGSGAKLPDVLAHVVRDEDGATQLTIKAPGAVPIAINGEPVEISETSSRRLRDGDAIRFGKGAKVPELLFHELRQNFNPLHPVRAVPAEASIAPEVPATVHPLTATLFVKELATSLWAEVPSRAKAYTLASVTGVVVFVVLLVYFNFQSLHANQQQISRLEEQIERDRAAREAGLISLEEQKKRLDELQRIYEGNRDFAERINELYSGGVCLIAGTYSFVDRDSGRPLRYESPDDASAPVFSGTGDLLASVDGQGPPVEVEFTGTGFLVAPGLVLTNRHVVQPWWHDETAQTVLAQGMKAKLDQLNAYFPQLKTPFTLRVQQNAEQEDVALCRFSQGDTAIPVLPLQEEKSPPTSAGKAIVLLGYPTGVEGLVERLADADRAAVAGRGRSVTDVAAVLAERGAIRPLTTQGIIGDVVPGRIVHNAATTEGGSGGPMFDDSGRVIGINAAILVSSETGASFGGSNFGVPISLAIPIIKEAGGQ